MCGLAGFFGKKFNTPDNIKIKKCLSSLRRRGPDANGIVFKSYKNKKLLFLHTRLSIIDLKKNSNQPIEDENGLLIFNGMIYNYIELKKKLKLKGIKFKTSSDTEVLLKMLNVYKEKAFDMLDGMWSLAYYDFKNSSLILSRDRFGEKPLYYIKKKKDFFFSNSIKSLYLLSDFKLKFNNTKLRQQLSYSDKSIGINNNTLFKDIKSVPPASYIKIDMERGTIKNNFFWKLRLRNRNITFSKATKKLEYLIKKVVRTRVRSDVKNSILISGGLDSNTIAHFAKKNSDISGYSLVSSNKNYDERKLIKINNKKNRIKLRFIKSTNSSSLVTLENIIDNSFNILPTTSALGFALLCRKIQKDGKRVILTGVGGDELFAGYYVNFLAHLLSYSGSKYIEKFNFWNTHIKKYIRNEKLKNLEDKKLFRNRYNLNFFIEEDKIKNKYLKFKSINKIKVFSKDIFFNNMLQNFLIQNVPTQNYANDLVSMFFSLESRSPFLSRTLSEFIYSLRKDYFMFKGKSKSLLRSAMKSKLHKDILNNYEKTGFYSPFSSFFTIRDFTKVKNYLNNSKVIYKFIKKNKIKKLLKLQPKKITHGESKLLFACLNFAILEKKLNFYNKKKY